MKSIIIIGIVLAGIIGGIAIFASIDSETWQDKRVGTIGVASPDEIDEKINCMSKSGVWDGASCNAKPVELENTDVIVQSINNFEGCITAGNDAIESYPRQCRTIDGQHFVEILDEPSCDESYPDVCITPYPIDLDCDEISYSNFRVIGSDPHGFDRDRDGIGCES